MNFNRLTPSRYSAPKPRAYLRLIYRALHQEQIGLRNAGAAACPEIENREAVMESILQMSGVLTAHLASSSQKVPDEMLIAAIATGDKRAMELLFARHNLRVFRFVHRLTGSRPLAEEIVSDVFFAVWRVAGGFEEKSRVSTWLLAIARHKAIAVLRRRAEAQLDDEDAATIPDGADDPETSAHQASRSALVQKCLQRLPPAHRELIDLVYYHEKTVAEAARIVGIPEGTVKTRMLRARQRMSELLKQVGIDGLQAC
jgi:RNA polymerase sigma-70 factor (ECF subfamily)